MGEVTQSIDVDVNLQTAYNQWTQFEEFPRFMEGVERIDQLDDRRLKWTVDIAGVEREFETEITEQNPDERIAWKSTSGLEQAGVVTFHRLNDEQSRVTLQMAFDPEGFVEHAGDKLGLVTARVRGDLERFKEFIEDRQVETGGWRGEISRPDESDDESYRAPVPEDLTEADLGGADAYVEDPYAELEHLDRTVDPDIPTTPEEVRDHHDEGFRRLGG